MKLLPFIVSKPYKNKILDHDIEVYRIAFLLDNGTDIWDEPDAASQLEINEIYPYSQWKDIDSITYVPVNNEKTQIQNFVLYEEDPNQGGLVWRTFFYFLDTTTEKSFLDSWKYPANFETLLNNALKVWNDINIE